MYAGGFGQWLDAKRHHCHPGHPCKSSDSRETGPASYACSASDFSHPRNSGDSGNACYSGAVRPSCHAGSHGTARQFDN